MEEFNIGNIKKLVKTNKLRWTRHVIVRLLQRNISQLDVKDCLQNGEIIEIYEDSYPYPSCLVYGVVKDDKILHTVVGYGEDTLWIITAYYQNDIEWENNFKKRREIE